MIRIVIIIQNTLVIKSLKILLRSEEKLKVISTALNVDEGIKLVESLQPEVVIYDLSGMTGQEIETMRNIVKASSQSKLLIYTTEKKQMLQEAIAEGVKGYLLQNSSTNDLIAAIYAAYNNNIYIASEAIDRQHFSRCYDRKLKIKHFTHWFARKTIEYWRKDSSKSIPTAEDTISQLGFSSVQLENMKSFLGDRNDKNADLISQITKEIDGILAQLKTSKPKKEIIKKRQQILGILDRETTSAFCYLNALEVNFQSLQAQMRQKFRKTLYSLNKETSPYHQQKLLGSVKKVLIEQHKLIKWQIQNYQDKRQSALSAFERVLSPSSRLESTLETCRRAVILAYTSHINADICELIAQITTDIIEQLQIQLEHLNKTNLLLLESMENMGEYTQKDAAIYTIFIEETHPEAIMEELLNDVTIKLTQPLELWGVSASISSSKIENILLEKLLPTTQQLYTKLQQEVILGFSFSNCAKSEENEQIVDSCQNKIAKSSNTSTLIKRENKHASISDFVLADYWLD